MKELNICAARRAARGHRLARVSDPRAGAGYPVKPIRVVIGYAPGGAADAGIRPLARALEPLLGQPLVIETNPGNAGGVAMEFIAKAPADGYYLYYFDSGPLTVAPHLAKVGYNILSSFTHLGHVCGSGSMLVVHPSTPFHSVADVVAGSIWQAHHSHGFNCRSRATVRASPADAAGWLSIDSGGIQTIISRWAWRFSGGVAYCLPLSVLRWAFD